MKKLEIKYIQKLSPPKVAIINSNLKAIKNGFIVEEEGNGV